MMETCWVFQLSFDQQRKTTDTNLLSTLWFQHGPLRDQTVSVVIQLLETKQQSEAWRYSIRHALFGLATFMGLCCVIFSFGSDFNTLLLLLKYLKTKLRCHADVLLQHQHGECLMHIVEVQVHVRPCHNGISRVQTKNGFLGTLKGFWLYLVLLCITDYEGCVQDKEKERAEEAV